MSLSIATKGQLTGAVYQLLHKIVVHNKVRGSDLAKALSRVQNSVTDLHQDGKVLDPYVKSTLMESLSGVRSTLMSQNSAVLARKERALNEIEALINSVPPGMAKNQATQQPFQERDAGLIRAAYGAPGAVKTDAADDRRTLALTAPGLWARYGHHSTA